MHITHGLPWNGMATTLLTKRVQARWMEMRQREEIIIVHPIRTHIRRTKRIGLRIDVFIHFPVDKFCKSATEMYWQAHSAYSIYPPHTSYF